MAPRRPRSPIRLRPDPVISQILDEKTFLWECDEERLRAAQFVQRDDPSKFAVLHQTTKPGNAKWQVSFFDSEGAVGDSSEKTCKRALREHLPRRVYRLRSVESFGRVKRRRR